jgi:MinD-like ATPase involved in chromosome partitioning or flagellar assembly
MSSIVSIHSFRGGTGKSNLSANISSVLAQQGYKVGVVDTDIASPGIHVLFQMDEEQMTTALNDYLWGKCDIQDCAYDVSEMVGLKPGHIFLIPSSIRPGEIARLLREGYDVALLNDGFHELIDQLALDYLVIDTHPGVNEETILSIAVSDQLIIILRPDQQDFQGTAVTLDVARKLEVPNLYLVVNMVLGRYMETIGQQVSDTYECEVIGVLPLSKDVVAVGSGEVFCIQHPDHDFSRRVTDIAKRLMLSDAQS